MLTANHRQQEDFRLDDVGARVRRQQSQGDVYNIIFMLSGVLSLIGGGMVNVNIQMASLKERVREVGVKMAIGASGPRGLQGVHDRGAAADRLLGSARRARRRHRLLEDHHAPRSASRSTWPRRASCGRTCWPWSSASCSRSTRRGRPAACRRWRRCAMSESALPLPRRRRRRRPGRAAGACPSARALALVWEVVTRRPASSCGRTSCARLLTLTLLMLGVFALVVMTSVLDGVMDKVATGFAGHELGRHDHARAARRRRRPRSRSASR